MMKNLATIPEEYHTLNGNQKMVADAYNGKYMNFYPTAETGTFSVANPLQFAPWKKFNPFEKIDIKIQHCPPNSYINVYVVRHQTYTENTPIIGLEYCIAPIMNALVDFKGEYSIRNNAELWNLYSGDYDIVVDVNRDGIINFSFDGIIDGVAGLDPNMPGFSVEAHNGNFCFIIDQTYSMEAMVGGGGSSRYQTGRQLIHDAIGSLAIGDVVMVMSFATEPHNWFAYEPGQGGNGYSGTNVGWLVRIRSAFDISELQVRVMTVDMPCYREPTTAWSNTPGAHNDPGWSDIRSPWAGAASTFDTQYTPLVTAPCTIFFLSDGIAKVPHWIDFEYTESDWAVNYIHAYRRAAECLHSNEGGVIPKVYTVHLGSDTGSFAGFMETLANQRNGEFYNINDGISNAGEWMRTKMRENRGIGEQAQPPWMRGTIEIGDSVERNVPLQVENGLDQIVINLTWDLSDFNVNDALPLSLTDPNGTLIDPENLSNTIQYIHALNSNKYQIQNPIPGTWIAHFSRNTNIMERLEYSLSLTYNSLLYYDVEAPPITMNSYETIHLELVATDFQSPACSAEVSVTISNADHSMVVTMYDDGLHGDNIAGDGNYGCYFNPEGESGIYNVQYNTYVQAYNANRVSNFAMNIADAPIQITYHSGWNWKGFPKLVRDENGLADAETVLEPMQPYCTSLLSQDGGMKYGRLGWEHSNMEEFSSIPGYKFYVQDIKTLGYYEQGTQLDDATTYTFLANQWYWLDYPCNTTTTPQEAFMGIWDWIDKIQAEKWSMKRLSNGTWGIGIKSSAPMLEYGDGVIIHVTADCTMQWGPRSPHPAVVRKATSVYTFSDQPDYETIMINSIENAPVFDEIGVFQNGNCLGAQVFEGYPIQILVYPDSTAKNESPYDIKIHEMDKGETCFTSVTYEDESLAVNDSPLYPLKNGFRIVSLKTDNQSIPPVAILSQNYPNPFNHSTKIAFGIPKDAKTELKIYNIKGQLVKTLVNKELKGGSHNLSWEGRDENNVSVASGIYFMTLKHNNKKLVRKMMVIK